MTQDYLQNWNLMVEKMQKPFQELLDLNVKTFQSLTYLKPEEITSLNLKQPGELLDKQVKLMMKNNHIILEYMAQSFQLFEYTLSSFSNQFKENAVQSNKPSGTASKSSGTSSSKGQKAASEKKEKTRKSSDYEKTTKSKQFAATPNILKNSKKKTPSNTTPQTKVKSASKISETGRKLEVASRKKALPENKPMRKTMLSESKKDNSISKSLISKERPKKAVVVNKAISQKKEDRRKTKMTKLEREMGMPEPIPDLLLNPATIPDEPISNLTNILNSTERHPNQYEHPLPPQEGKGKNPFKK